MKQSEHRITLELGGKFDSSLASKPFIILMEGYTDQDAISLVLGAIGDWFHVKGTAFSGVFSSLPEIDVATSEPAWRRSAQHDFGPVLGWKFFGKFVQDDLSDEQADELAVELSLAVAKRIEDIVSLIFNGQRTEVMPS